MSDFDKIIQSIKCLFGYHIWSMRYWNGKPIPEFCTSCGKNHVDWLTK